jgi:death-on-curing protein
VLAIHARAIEEFGGLHGVCDAGALEAALTAVENRAYYEYATLIACAATYAYHLTQAHAFLDGNKRVAAHVPARVVGHTQPKRVCRRRITATLGPR